MKIQEIVVEALRLGAIQKPSELAALLDFLAKDPPKSVVEIGTAKGGTLFALCQVSDPKAKIVSIDLPGGAFGGGYSKEDWKKFLTFKHQEQDLRFLRANSHLTLTRLKLIKLVGRKEIDFLMIDGDHTYEGVKRDFELYSPLVKKGGVIALHDILYHPYVPDCQVEKFWQEIKNQYKYQEFIDKNDITWGGIGLIQYGPEMKPMIKAEGLLLDIGFTDQRQRGFMGMRLEPGPDADIVHDIEKFPWPLEDNSVHICVGHHVIEHIKPWLIFQFFDELWRVVKPNGQVALSTPYAGSMAWWSDPSHCTGFNERSFAYLDPEQEAYKSHKPKPWRIEKGSPTWHTNANLECILIPVK